ncbi:MAG: M16 family metallopeptidase, partial [Burkholderiales bacterium]
PGNIKKRLSLRTLDNSVRLALLPKRTRGGTVVARLDLHWGNEHSTQGRSTACALAGDMLLRGTRKHTRAQLRDAFERLQATVSVDLDGATIETRRPYLAETLGLVAEALREPSFPAEEFDELRRSAVAAAQSQLSDPSAIAGEALRRYLAPYPKGHWRYEPSLQERIADLKTARLEDARACYRDLVGGTGADVAVVGDFDADAVTKQLGQLLSDWKNPSPYGRIPLRFFELPAMERSFETPDKANATLRAGVNVAVRDDDPDFPALVLANYLLGGSPTARLAARIREKEGLSYATYSGFSASPREAAGQFWVSSIFAPQNRDQVERAMREELARAERDGFGDGEVAAAKRGLLEARRLARTQDGALAARLATYLHLDRSFDWDIALEGHIEALTPGQLRDVLRRRLDLGRLAVTTAGDFDFAKPR